MVECGVVQTHCSGDALARGAGQRSHGEEVTRMRSRRQPGPGLCRGACNAIYTKFLPAGIRIRATHEFSRSALLLSAFEQSYNPCCSRGKVQPLVRIVCECSRSNAFALNYSRSACGGAVWDVNSIKAISINLSIWESFNMAG